MLIYGINSVVEAIRSGRVRELRVADRQGGRVAEAIAAAQRVGIQVRRVQATELDRAAKGGVHQGVVAEVEGSRDYSIGDLVSGASGVPLLSLIHI